MWAIQPGAVQARRDLPGGGVVYLRRDQFTSDESAPIATPHTCVPGPGSMVVVQNDGQFATSGGKLVITAQSTAAWGDLGQYDTVPITRVTGRTLAAKWKPQTSVSNDGLIGFGNGAGVSFANVVDGLSIQLINANFAGLTSAGANFGSVLTGRVAGVEDQVFIVLRSTGALLIAQNKLIWPHATGNTANLYMTIAVNQATTNSTIDDFIVADAGGLYATDYGIATDRKAVSAAGDTISTTADGFVEHTFTAQTGVTKNIMVRYLDDNNCWIVRCDQAGSTIKLIEKNAGVEAERDSDARTWVNGTSYRVIVRCVAADIRTYDEAAGGGTNARSVYTSATFQQTQVGAKVDHIGTNLVSWPFNVTAPAV
jgi:hypothetical protein